MNEEDRTLLRAVARILADKQITYDMREDWLCQSCGGTNSHRSPCPVESVETVIGARRLDDRLDY